MINRTSNLPTVQGAQNIIPNPSLPTPQNNMWLFDGRLPVPDTDTDGMPIITPINPNFPTYEYYKCYALPPYLLTNAMGAVEYFKNCGFTVGYGYSNTITLNSVAAVDIVSNASLNQAILYYTSGALVQSLVGLEVTGSFVDTTHSTVTGNLVSASVGSFTYLTVPYAGKIILESSQFATIAVNDVIAISYVNLGITVPDANTTDYFIMDIYQAILAGLIPQDATITAATPQIYFSILPDSASSAAFGPSAAPMTLSSPTAVVLNVPAATAIITLAVPSNNVGYVPLTAAGTTTITQGAAVGTFDHAVVNGAFIDIYVTFTTGTFATGTAIVLNMDPTANVFAFQTKLFATLKISLAVAAFTYEVVTNADINENYPEAFAWIAANNLPQVCTNGQSICQMVFANMSTPYGAAIIPGGLANDINTYLYLPVYYNYQPILGELPLGIGQLASAFAMVIASNVYPLNPQGEIIINGLPTPTDSNKWIDVGIGGDADIIQGYGYNPIAVNTTGQAYIIAPRVGQTTLPNLPIVNKEYAQEYLWQTISYLKLGVILIVFAIGLNKVRQNPRIISTLKAQIFNLMMQMDTDGLLLNVAINEQLITVRQDATNPLGIDVRIPTQVVPALKDVYFFIDIFSSTINLTSIA
jgi:hypothetical protein